MDLPLDQLRALAAVVRQGTFEAAAAALSITPSAVSQRIKNLEQAAGRVLVERSKPVRVTSSGATVLRLARQVDLAFADAARELGEGPSAGPVEMPIVVSADSFTTWVLAALAGIPDLAERLVLRIHREDEHHSTDLLRNGTVMGAVTAVGEPVQGCSVTPLGRMRYRPRAHPALAARWFPDGFTAAACERAPMVVFDEKDRMQDDFVEAVHGAMAPSMPRHRIPSSADFADAVRLGLGWGMLPDLQADDSTVVLHPMPHDVPLYWQQWKLRTPLLDEVARAVATAAVTALRPL